MNKVKNKKKFIIWGIILVIVAIIIVVTLVILGKKDNTNLQEVLNGSVEIKGIVDEEKRIELMNLDEEKSLDKVTVWLFSDPVYLGEFNLVKIDNKYYLEGLNDALKDKDIVAGSHRLLVMNKKEAVGYIRVEITDDKELKIDDIYNVNEKNTDLGLDDNTGIKDSNTSDKVSQNKDENTVKKEEQTKKDNSKTEEVKKEDTVKEEVKQEEVKKEDKVPEEPKQEEVKCSPKKFKHKYTYFYEDKETCIKNGDHDDAWEYFKANGISAYTYGCEEIIDECGTKYYGVYYGNMEGEKYYY